MATNPTLLTQPIAANGAKNVIPNTTSTAGAMSQDQGFPAETALPLGAGGVAPSREDFNGAFNLLSELMFYAQKGWQFEFDELQDYFAGCIVRDTLDGKLYEAINDVPASSTHPSADSVNWKEFGNPDLSNYANKQLSNLDTANLACHVVVDSYYDSTTGDWYREYDDGWLEQGGLVMNVTASESRQTANLLRPFADTNYTCLTTCFVSSNGSMVNAGYLCEYTSSLASPSTRTTTAVTFSYSANRQWVAYGMGASV